MDRRDSLGVCIDSESEEESLQRDQAVCISTNGTPPQIDETHVQLVQDYKSQGESAWLTAEDSSLKLVSLLESVCFLADRKGSHPQPEVSSC